MQSIDFSTVTKAGTSPAVSSSSFENPRSESAAHLLAPYIEYLRFGRSYSVNTIAAYRNGVRQFLIFVETDFGGVLSRVSAGDLLQFIMHYREGGACARSANVFISALVSFYDYCVTFGRGGVSENIALSLKRQKEPKALPESLPSANIVALIEQHIAKPNFSAKRTAAVIALGYFAGLRCSEIAALRWSDIDFARRFLFVRGGKGLKDRVVPVASFLGGVLRNYQSVCNSPFVAAWSSTSPLTRRQLGAIIKKALLQIAPDRLAHPHILRSSCATAMAAHHVSVLDIAQFLGHTSLETTLRYISASYSHLQININEVL